MIDVATKLAAAVVDNTRPGEGEYLGGIINCSRIGIDNYHHCHGCIRGGGDVANIRRLTARAWRPGLTKTIVGIEW